MTFVVLRRLNLGDGKYAEIGSTVPEDQFPNPRPWLEGGWIEASLPTIEDEYRVHHKHEAERVELENKVETKQAVTAAVQKPHRGRPKKDKSEHEKHEKHDKSHEKVPHKPAETTHEREHEHEREHDKPTEPLAWPAGGWNKSPKALTLAEVKELMQLDAEKEKSEKHDKTEKHGNPEHPVVAKRPVVEVAEHVAPPEEKPE